MPVITQENGLKTVAGLPLRWGVRAYKQLQAAQAGAVGAMPQAYKDLSALLDRVTGAAIPVDATDSSLCILAERYAAECASSAATIHDTAALRVRMAHICTLRGIAEPDFEDDMQVIHRCTDPAWWRRNLRKTHGRAFEHAAMQMGFVSNQSGKYCSDETVARRVAQNRRNANALKATTMINTDTGQDFKLSELAAKGTGNKKIRRGELMMRMAGCNDIAVDLGHLGLFVTMTAPSKYHAVLQKSGDRNPKYNGATPLQAHEHLKTAWERTRAQNARDGLTIYGFRVAEPHHDGCAHWHMIFFMPKDQIEQFQKNLTKYACEEDRAELGDDVTPRIKFVDIDPTKDGGAAAYMMKYVGKNIGENEVIEDLFGNTIITKEMRVDAWAGVWGIRQFQPVGQPPVTAWREFRRVKEKVIKNAPECVQAAHAACQRVFETDEDGVMTVTHAANWAEYIQAQGGVKVGEVKTKQRDYSGAVVVPYKSKAKAGQFYFVGIKTKTVTTAILSHGAKGGYLIGLAAPVVAVEGRYGLLDCAKPIGVYCKVAPDVVYQSTRYTWKKNGGGVAFRFPWSSVNNCTPSDIAAAHRVDRMPDLLPDYDPKEWFESEEAGQAIFYPHELAEMEAHYKAEAKLLHDNTVFTEPLNKKLRRMYRNA